VALTAVETIYPPMKINLEEGFFMPRKVRELLDGGIYHIFNRGNDRRKLFQDPEDFRYFLNQLNHAKEELKAVLYHYCLMTNHFHLLLQVVEGGSLPRLMHRAQLAYARYFKKKYKFMGHVFQERFRSPRIPEESYYLQCGRYIERNPVKAGLVKDATEYIWSSAAYYAHGRPDPLVTPNLYYNGMGVSSTERQDNYQKFLSIDEPYSAIVDQALTRV